MGQWSELLVEMLEAIEENVILYEDKVRLRSVCVRWHSPLPKLPHQELHQSPCMLLPYDNDRPCALFNPLDKKFYQLDKLPKLEQGGKLFKGSSHGWVVTVDDSPSLCLINPLTGAQLKLPPRSIFPDVVKYRRDKIGHEYAIRKAYGSGYYTLGARHVRNFFTSKIVLSANPATSDDYLAVAIYGEFDRLAYCRKGFKKWVHLDGVRTPYGDAIFFQGHLYALTLGGRLLICEVSHGQGPKVKKMIEPARPPKCVGSNQHYLVEHSSGLLMVERVTFRYRSGEPVRTCRFIIYRLDPSNSSWVEVKDLGGDALFLGLNLSLSISSGDFPEFKGNCIYFTDDSMDMYDQERIQQGEGGGGFDMGIYDLNDGNIENLPMLGGCKLGANMFWPPPIWVTPKR